MHHKRKNLNSCWCYSTLHIRFPIVVSILNRFQDISISIARVTSNNPSFLYNFKYIFSLIIKLYETRYSIFSIEKVSNNCSQLQLLRGHSRLSEIILFYRINFISFVHYNCPHCTISEMLAPVHQLGATWSLVSLHDVANVVSVYIASSASPACWSHVTTFWDQQNFVDVIHHSTA